MPVVISNYIGGTPRDLARGLRWPISKVNPRKPRIASLVLNWGTTATVQAKRGAKVLNKPENVVLASDKLLTFKKFAKIVPTLEWTEDPKCAMEWLKAGSSVVARKLLRASAGRGIEIVKWEEWKAAGKPKNAIPQAPLYTRYFPKTREVRVHVFNGQVIAYAEKRKPTGVQADRWVRSHNNGWIFATQGVERSPAATEAAILAVRTLGLDFGAVDICIGKNSVAVLEVNTAPGLEGCTLEAYTNALRGFQRNA